MAKTAAKTKGKAKGNGRGKAMGMSLHIGLNSVSRSAYGGWSGPLAACEADAKDMTAIAKQQGIRPTTLLTKKATRAAVLAEMRKAAQLLAAGDLYVLSFSGHGGARRLLGQERRRPNALLLGDGGHVVGIGFARGERAGPAAIGPAADAVQADVERHARRLASRVAFALALGLRRCLGHVVSAP